MCPWYRLFLFVLYGFVTQGVALSETLNFEVRTCAVGLQNAISISLTVTVIVTATVCGCLCLPGC